MTRDEILNMSAGREMDALIAVHVFGQTDFAHPNVVYLEGATEDGEDGWSGFYCPRCHAGENDATPATKCVLHYSTDIASAWLVVEKSTCFTVENRQNYRPDEWYCEVAFGGFLYDAKANTAPLAICRAALLALLNEAN